MYTIKIVSANVSTIDLEDVHRANIDNKYNQMLCVVFIVN